LPGSASDRVGRQRLPLPSGWDIRHSYAPEKNISNNYLGDLFNKNERTRP
jgi:predicted dithiol-disulfide oxidoreductase (DUF899 family)